MSPSDKGRSSLHANYSVRTGYTRQFLSYFHECSFILGFCIFPNKKTIPNRRLLVLRRVPESTSLLLTSVSRSTPTFGGAVQSPCGPRFHTKTSPLIKDSHPPALVFSQCRSTSTTRYFDVYARSPVSNDVIHVVLKRTWIRRVHKIYTSKSPPIRTHGPSNTVLIAHSGSLIGSQPFETHSSVKFLPRPLVFMIGHSRTGLRNYAFSIQSSTRRVDSRFSMERIGRVYTINHMEDYPYF